jgi:hypothetical protein
MGMMVRGVLYAVWYNLAPYAKFIVLACVYPFALLGVKAMILLRRWGVISFKDE